MKRIFALLVFLTVLCVSLPVTGILTTYEPVDDGVLPPRPDVGVPYVDPIFNTVLTRLTDPSMSPSTTTSKTLGIVHEYSRYPVPNADNTKMIVTVIGGAENGAWEVRGLFDQKVYNTIQTKGDPEFSWHPQHPNHLFYRYGNEVRGYFIDTDTIETRMVLTGYSFLSANEEGRPDDSWRYYAAVATKNNGQTDIVSLDLDTQTVLGTIPNVNPSSIDWVSVTPSGQWVVVMWTDGQGTKVYDRNLVFQRQLLSDFGHADFALDENGEDVIVYQATSGKQVSEVSCPNPPNGSPFVSSRLKDARKRILLGDCNTADWTPVITGTYIGWWFDVHLSGIISRSRPGWVLASSYSPMAVTGHPFLRCIFLIALDGSGRVERYAHTHTLVATDANGNRDYWAEPHASSSWDGSLILFTSTWGSAFEHYDMWMLRPAAGPPVPPLPPVPPVTPPTEFTAPYGTAVVSWTWEQGNGSAATGFRVKCGTVSGNPTAIKQIKDPTRRSVPLRNVVPEPGRYFCQVVAFGTGGESLPSAEIVINATSTTPAPNAPSTPGVL